MENLTLKCTELPGPRETDPDEKAMDGAHSFIVRLGNWFWYALVRCST